MIPPTDQCSDILRIWLIDDAGNVAISISDVALLRRIAMLFIPVFTSTEEAMEWGTHLSTQQRATLQQVQRTISDAALAESDPQRMIDLATQSQLMREAAEALPGRFMRTSLRTAARRASGGE